MGSSRVTGSLCGHKVGRSWLDPGTSCQTQHSPPGSAGSSGHHGQIKRLRRARELLAADARGLIRAALPALLDKLTPSQIQQVQLVFDAAVVDPQIQNEAAVFYRQAERHYGNQVWIDPDLRRRGDRIMKGYIPISESQKRVQIDYQKLLTSDSLKPRTDNPEEASYLASVQQTLKNEGVWLRFGPKLVANPQDKSHYHYDPKYFEVWLSLGPRGDQIPTRDGSLTREAILGTTRFGAGFYEKVFLGGVQTTLKKQINRLSSEIDAGLEQHRQLQVNRATAAPGVVWTSDKLGGASFPSDSIWEIPRQLVLKAMDANVGGNVKESRRLLIVAGGASKVAAGLMAEYIEKSSVGGTKAVRFLQVVQTAADVILIALMVVDGAILLRGAWRAGARMAAKDVSTRAFAKTPYAGSAAYADTANLALADTADVALADTAKVAGGSSGNTAAQAAQATFRQRVKLWNDEFSRLMAEAQKARGGSNTLQDFLRICEECDGKYGKIAAEL